MSQSDYTVDNGTGLLVRTDFNVQLGSVATMNSGATAPATIFANQWWFDTSTSLIKQRNNGNTAWINIARKDSDGYIPYYAKQLLGSIETVTHSVVGDYTPLTTAGTFKDVSVETDMNIQVPGTVDIPAPEEDALVDVAYYMNLKFKIDATGGYDLTWSNSYTFIGLEPTIPNSANKESIFLIWTLDGGTTWYVFGDVDKSIYPLVTTIANDDLILLRDASDNDAAKSVEVDRLTNAASEVTVLGNQSGNITPDFGQDNFISFTLVGAVTVTEPMIPPKFSWLGKLNFLITADGTNDVTWPSSVTWGDGSVPNVAGENAGVSVRVVLETWDGGTSYFGFLIRNG